MAVSNSLLLFPLSPNSVRKERKIRPGFTPQEDVARFRSTRQQAIDARALPKGHVPGWTPPGAAVPEKKDPQSKSAKKNEKRREKRKEKRQEAVRESWDSEDEQQEAGATPVDKEVVAAAPRAADSTTSSPKGQHIQNEDHTRPEIASTESGVDAVTDQLDKLSV
jgi:partner of Y14 and mago